MAQTALTTLLRFEEWHPETHDVSALQRAEQLLETVLRRRFARQAKVVSKRLRGALPALLARRGFVQDPPPEDVARVIDIVWPQEDEEDELITLRAAMATATSAGSAAVLTQLGMSLEAAQFMLVNREAVLWLQNQLNDLFRSVDDTTKRRIGQSLASGLDRGEHLDELTGRVARVLREGGWRARMIAQTETMNAYSRSTEQTAAALGVQQMQWLDGQLGACPICVDLHKAVKQLPNGEYRGQLYERSRPPAHPACRCVQVAYEEEVGDGR